MSEAIEQGRGHLSITKVEGARAIREELRLRVMQRAVGRAFANMI